MQKKSSTTRPKSMRRESKQTKGRLAGVLGAVTNKHRVYRVTFLISTRKAIKEFAALLKTDGLTTRAVDEIELRFFIKRPEKKGGYKR